MVRLEFQPRPEGPRSLIPLCYGQPVYRAIRVTSGVTEPKKRGTMAKTRHAWTVTALVLVMAATGLPGATAAGPSLVTVVDTFSAGGYSPNISDSARSATPGPYQDHASSFTVNRPVRLVKIALPLTSRNATVPGTVATLLVTSNRVTSNPVSSDPALIDVPNTDDVLDRVTVRKITSDFSGRIYQVTSIRKPTLQPGQRYWLVLLAPRGDVTWLVGSETAGSVAADRQMDARIGFVWVSYSRLQVDALRLRGTPVGA